MDKDNKYYGIIENLVRNHKKFSGLEDIIEDIIDDVYTHSQAILETINDESVIDGYLSKVVSTSIITVPKKLNRHHEYSHRSQSFEKPVKTIEQIVSESEPLKAQEEQIVPEQEPLKEQQEQIVLEPESLKEQEEQIENFDVSVEEFENVKDEIVEEDNTLELFATEEGSFEEKDLVLDTEEEPEPEISNPNNNLVDKMINSITEDTLKENGLSDELSEDELGELLPAKDEIEDIAEEPLNYSDVSSEENLSELQVEDSVNTEETDTLDFIANEDDEDAAENIFADEEDDDEKSEYVIQELDSVEDILESQEEDGNIEAFDNDEPQQIDEEQISFVEEGSLETFEESDLLEIAEDDQELAEDIESDIVEQDDAIDFSDDTEEELLEADNILDMTLNASNADSDLMMSEEKEVKIAKETDLAPVNYSAFEYNPDEKGNYYESDDIAAKLFDMDKQEPDLNILKIFDLKYKHNLTIEEIMAELNLEKQDVIAALDKMVELI